MLSRSPPCQHFPNKLSAPRLGNDGVRRGGAGRGRGGYGTKSALDLLFDTK